MNQEAKLQKPERLWTRFFIIICGASLFANFCLQCFNTVKSIYITDMGGTTSFVGLLSIIGLACTTLLRLISGRMSDSMSKRKVVIIGLAIYIVAMLGFGFTPNLQVLIFFSALQSIGYSMSATALSVLLADVLPRSRLSEGIGYSGLTSSLSSAIGPGIALAMMNAMGYKVLFVSLAIYLAISAVFVVFCRYENDPAFQERRARELEEIRAEEAAKAAAAEANAKYTGILKFIEPKAIPYTILSALYTMPMGFVVTYLALYGTTNGIENIGLFFTFSAVAMVVARLVFGKLADRFGMLLVIAPAIVMYGVAFTLILIAPTAPGFVVCLAGLLYGLAGGIINPVLNAAVLKSVPPERRGAASGTYMISFDVGIAGGGAIWGVTIEHMGYDATISICIAITAAALVLAFFILGKRRVRQA